MLMSNEWVIPAEAVDDQKVPRAQRVTRVNEFLSTSPVNNDASVCARSSFRINVGSTTDLRN